MLEQQDALARVVETDAGVANVDHRLPPRYTVGARGRGRAGPAPITGFDMSSLSMRSVLFG